MNKNTVLKIVSATIALSMVVGFYGCKSNRDGIKTKGELVEPSVVSSTAVVTYTSVDANGKEVDATKVATIDEEINHMVSVGTKLDQSIESEDDKKAFVEDSQKDYGISQDKAEEIVNDAENWVKFSYTVYVTNTNSKKAAFRFATSDKNDNIIVSNDLGCEYGVMPGNVMAIDISGLANVSKYPDSEEIKNQLNNMNVKIQYAVLEDSNADIDDWNAITTQTIKVAVSDD